MNEETMDEAAVLLADARLAKEPFERLPDKYRPSDEAEAYGIQDRLHARLEAAGLARRIGYKIGCTTAVMQRYLGIGNPCAGGLYEGGVHRTPARLRHGDYLKVGVECEIAVRLGADLPPAGGRHDRESVGEAVESCLAAIEIVDDRYQDYRSLDTPTLIADDFFNAGAVLGPEVRDWRVLDLAAVRGRMTVNGETVGEGQGGAILGHPFEALAWLANTLNARKKSLKRGEIVLLGSLIQTQWLPPETDIAITIDGLGEVAACFE